MMDCHTFTMMYLFIRERDDKLIICQLFDYDGQSVTYVGPVNDFNWTDDFGCNAPFYLDDMMELHA